MTKLNSRVWNKSKLTENAKLRVYLACVLSSILDGSETRTSTEGKKSDSKVSIYGVLDVQYNTHPMAVQITSSEVPELAGIPSMFVSLSNRRLMWLGHLQRMNLDRIPNDLLYGELAEGSRPVERLRLRYKDIKLKEKSDIDVNKWES